MVTTDYRFTVADLENFPDDGNRYEIIDGELYVSRAPHGRHQVVLDQVIIALGTWHNQYRLGQPLSGAGVVFAEDQAVIPDLVWVSNARKPVVFRGDGKLHAAPDLVVEILSPGEANEQRDRSTKLKLYSRQGVKEYWILDREARQVQVYHRQQGILALALTLSPTDTLSSPLLPQFAVRVEMLFPETDVNI